VNEEWLERWKSGHTGWHEAQGNTALHKFWPKLAPGSRVLVPLCGKSVDMLWLEQQGLDVTGVELCEIAVRAFFAESGILFDIETGDGLTKFKARGRRLAIHCGDYFDYSDGQFDAVYDRAALVALPPELRPAYAEHTKSLMKPAAHHLLITLEYDQAKVNGPPFSVLADEVQSYWPELRRAGDKSALRNMPPKYREAHLSEFVEAVWRK